MGLIDALKAGNYKYLNNSGSNISIKTGEGNNNISVNGGNIDIKTGNGNQKINAITANNLSITTGTTGQDLINASAFKGTINTNGSDDVVSFTGTNFDISALDGNKTIMVSGNLNDTQSKNSIKLGNGALNQIRSTANNVDITSGNGALQLGFVGNNVGVTAGDGSHDIGFWGNNVDINLGNGNNSIQTLDFALANGNFNDFGADKILEKLTTVSTAIVGNEVTSTTFNPKDAIAAKYNLSDQEKAILNNIDLNAKFSDGNSLYALIRSPRKSAAAGHDVYVITKRDGTTHTWAVSDNECIATGAWQNATVNGAATSQQKTTTETAYFLNGVSDVNINTKDGNNSIFLTSDVKPDSNINIGLGNASTGNNILVRNGFTVKDRVTTTTTSQTTSSTNVLVNNGSTWNSPLIVDYNKDGKVSAKAGVGVDIDNNGAADGAATGGDKMLAMSDMNGNKNIDGQEVFGDQTVSPFTKEKINAANGFEALKVIAEQAKQYTGIDCMKNGNVDLQSLKTALATVGVNLGFISDGNTTQLEDLGHVAAINVSEYTEANATGDVQNRQLGSYTDTDGSTQKVDDVWFKALDLENKPNFLEILKKLG